jgi:hypothetical protein
MAKARTVPALLKRRARPTKLKCTTGSIATFELSLPAAVKPSAGTVQPGITRTSRVSQETTDDD